MATQQTKKQHNHRIEEALRAQLAVGREAYSANITQPISERTAPKSTITLSIPSIKRDLAKDLFFAIFAISMILFLKFSNFGYAQVTGLFSK
jgi:hypothetical protein